MCIFFHNQEKIICLESKQTKLNHCGTMDTPNILHEFNGNACELKITIENKGQNVSNCDIFIYESYFIFVSDADISRFTCPRQFDLTDIKNIPISFNTEQQQYTCFLPCYPESSEPKDKNPSNAKTFIENLNKFLRITDSCVLSVDGKICEIQADFSYGFSGLYRGKPKYNEDDLSHICRITDPSLLSPIKRIIQREADEIKDFCRTQYKIDFMLQVPEGHENPKEYTIPYDDSKLTTEEEYILKNIQPKYTPTDIETDIISIDCGLVSILLGICYDVRTTSNEPTCESSWTRTILSATLSYFEPFDNLEAVVVSFIRRSLVYPLYRNYDLARLCVEDAAKAMEKGKQWILKQLLVTYNCFCEADYNRKALNKYFIKHYIRYVDTVIDDDHLNMISEALQCILYFPGKEKLRLGLYEVEMEMLTDIIADFSLNLANELEPPDSRCESETDSNEGNESDTSSDEGPEISYINGKIVI